MDKEIITILISSILGSTVLTTLVQRFFDRYKTKVETHNISITGEEKASELYLKYAKEQQSFREQLKKDFIEEIRLLKDDHKSEVEKLKEEFQRIMNEKNERIKALELRVDELEKENKRYQDLGLNIDTVKDVIHTSVDEAAEKIKSEITPK